MEKQNRVNEHQKIVDTISKRHFDKNKELAQSKEKLQNNFFKQELGPSIFLGAFFGGAIGGLVGSSKYFVEEHFSGQTLNSWQLGITTGIAIAAVPIVGCILRRAIIKRHVKKLEAQKNEIEQEKKVAQLKLDELRNER